MSRFNNNRGGLGMNNFQPRRGGGAGGPMRGGLMGHPNFRNHPFQNQNQNRRGPNNNFNRPPMQGTPQKLQQNQSLPIIPPPSPGPALTMKGPMQQQKPAQQEQEEQQRTPTTPAPQSTLQSPPPKPNITSPQPNQANNNQDQQLKSPVGSANGQQQKQPPQPSPKSTPQQEQKTGPQQDQKTGPPQGQKTGPQQGQKTGPQQGQRTGPQQGQRTGPQQGQRTGPQQGQRAGPQQGQRPGPQQGQRMGPQQGQRTPMKPQRERDESDRMATDNAAESDGSQSKVCSILCHILGCGWRRLSLLFANASLFGVAKNVRLFCIIEQPERAGVFRHSRDYHLDLFSSSFAAYGGTSGN